MGVRKRVAPKVTPNGAKRDETAFLKPRLLNSHELPAWYAHNDYILTSYRPVTQSAHLCFRSLTYFHNETVNIYSHLIPAVTALLGNYLLHVYFSLQFPHASWRDQLVFHIYLTTSVACFTISSVYHTLLCHSSFFADLWARLDYVAITFQILGSFVSGIYIGFYCEPRLQKTYWSMITILGLLTGFVVVHPRLQSKQWRSLRLSMFVATGFSAFAPIIHASLIFPYTQLDQQAGLRYYYLEGLVMLAGVFFYATRFPESWKPRRFDIWGASHQIFHLMVVAGAVIHWYGILTAFQWNYINQRCYTIP
ncbi:hemolysin-III channel protein Izh2 [Aspergillus ambiguus]|uniref:hemolysin III family protein n=1 Tax=Aspergillus ambiguus TaxID=176160 RepID=UPI003CCDCCFF